MASVVRSGRSRVDVVGVVAVVHINCDVADTDLLMLMLLLLLQLLFVHLLHIALHRRHYDLHGNGHVEIALFSTAEPSKLGQLCRPCMAPGSLNRAPAI